MARFLFAAFCVLAAPALAEDRYFGSEGDMSHIPIAPGLSEIPEAAGGFIHAGVYATWVEADGPASPASVEQFYSERLPILGWRLDPSQHANELVFICESGGIVERLTVRIYAGGGTTRLRISQANER